MNKEIILKRNKREFIACILVFIVFMGYFLFLPREYTFLRYIDLYLSLIAIPIALWLRRNSVQVQKLSEKELALNQIKFLSQSKFALLSIYIGLIAAPIYNTLYTQKGFQIALLIIYTALFALVLVLNKKASNEIPHS